jgi:hypothetical protein
VNHGKTDGFVLLAANTIFGFFRSSRLRDTWHNDRPNRRPPPIFMGPFRSGRWDIPGFELYLHVRRLRTIAHLFTFWSTNGYSIFITLYLGAIFPAGYFSTHVASHFSQSMLRVAAQNDVGTWLNWVTLVGSVSQFKSWCRVVFSSKENHSLCCQSPTMRTVRHAIACWKFSAFIWCTDTGSTEEDSCWGQ